jgi:hypothetical protein
MTESITRGAADPLTLALDLIARGIKPVPVPRNKKNPVIPRWQHLDITAENATQYFNGAALNVGAIMGRGGLTDVDLDCAEAVALAPHFLPDTHSIYGRPGKRRSHWLYTCSDPDPKASIKLTDETKACIVELRMGGGGKGAQSVMPGSTHTSGELYAWDKDGERMQAPCDALKAGITKIAVGTVLIRHWPARGSRHDAALVVGGFLARAGWTPDDVEQLVETICREHGEATDPAAHGHTARESAENYAAGTHVYGLPQMAEVFGEAATKQIAKLVGYRGRDAVEPTSEDGRPAMKVEGGQLSKMADNAEEALVAAGMQFFERSNALVRPIVKMVDAFHGRKTSSAQLAHIEQTYMRDVLCRVANWYRLDKRDRRWVAIDPPHDVASTILARAGEWKFPTVAGIITTQTMRPDGTILYQPGYDPATRLLLIDPPPMVPIPETPTRDDALAALAMLEALLTEFPLVSDVDMAVALSTFITPVVRGAFAVAPMHVVDAPIASSGKSYLLDTAASIVTGQPMPVIAAGGNEEETEKRLGAALLASQSLITIDNVSGELSGDALCQIIERPRPQVRILGKSELVEVEARGTTMFANGNNISIVGDLCRRVIRARLDPQVEQPELRVFTGNPVAVVLADRGAYVAAALTICRAYIVAGRPGLKPRLASFEGWCDTVRSALTWLGKADPVDSIETSRAEDPERTALSAMLTAWVGAFGTGARYGVTLKEVVETCAQVSSVDQMTNSVTLRYPELSEAVNSIMPPRMRADATALSYWMRSRKNRIVDAMWFENKASKDSTKWWVVRSNGAVVPGAANSDTL